MPTLTLKASAAFQRRLKRRPPGTLTASETVRAGGEIDLSRGAFRLAGRARRLLVVAPPPSAR